MASKSNRAAHKHRKAHGRHTGYAIVFASLAALFALRILGQALQHWAPVSFLPPFDSFQGSNLPYGLLLTSQLVLLALMSGLAWSVATGIQQPKPHIGVLFGWAGGIYMIGAIARIAVGLFFTDAPAWFTAWIPAGFHVALAGFILTLAAYHATNSTALDAEIDS